MSEFFNNNDYLQSILRPFGPTIMKFTLPDALIADFNAACDEISKSEELKNKLDFSNYLVGKVRQEFLIPDNVIDKHLTYFYNCLGAYYKFMFESGLVRKEKTNAKKLSGWFVRSFAGDFNPCHVHNGCNMSCVGYLKLPDWEAEKKADSQDNCPCVGLIDFIYGSVTPMQRHNWSAEPKIGDFYLFPSNLVHTVYPFKSDGERRSFSINFNLSIE
tara:strand:+ start:2798 stop:3445 length:648 start_codon:yes stop_codon:yes gene_type:complete